LLQVVMMVHWQALLYYVIRHKDIEKEYPRC
jgi:hypothetical protein